MSESLFLTVLVSALIAATWNIFAKRTGGDQSVLWLAQLLATILIAPIALMRAQLISFSPIVCVFLVATGMIQAAYFFLLSRAYRIGDFSVVYPIARGVGVTGTVLISRFYIGESLSPQGMLGVASVCLGVVFLGAKRLKIIDMKPLLYAVSIGCVLSAGATTDKFAVMRIDPIFYIFCMFGVACMIAAPFVLRTKRVELRHALANRRPTIVVIGFGTMGSYLIALYAFQQGSLAYVATIRESSVLIGALWGYLVMKESFTARRGIGMAAILTGLVLIRLA